MYLVLFYNLLCRSSTESYGTRRNTKHEVIDGRGLCFFLPPHTSLNSTADAPRFHLSSIKSICRSRSSPSNRIASLLQLGIDNSGHRRIILVGGQAQSPSDGGDEHRHRHTHRRQGNTHGHHRLPLNHRLDPPLAVYSSSDTVESTH